MLKDCADILDFYPNSFKKKKKEKRTYYKCCTSTSILASSQKLISIIKVMNIYIYTQKQAWMSHI